MDYGHGYRFGTDVSPCFAARVAPLLGGARVLDVGCGTGEYLRHFGPGSVGIDVAPANLEVASSRGLMVRRKDLNDLERSGETYDAVFVSQVLEHVDSPVALLRFARSALQPGGLLVMSVPNEGGVIHLRHPYFTGDGNHLYAFSEANLRELLAVVGFHEPTVLYDYHTALTRRLRLARVLELVDRLPRILRRRLCWSFWLLAHAR